MGYKTWTTNGLGIKVDDIKDVKKEGLISLLEKAPQFKAEAEETLKRYYECDTVAEAIDAFEMDDIDDVFDDGDFGDTGLALFLGNVMRESVKIPDFVVYADNFDEEEYLLFCPSYPWQMAEAETALTEEEVVNIFRSFVGEITNTPVDVDFYSVENGG